jgi:hypothetical protein
VRSCRGAVEFVRETVPLMFLLGVRRRQFGSGVDFGVGGRIKTRHFFYLK